MHLAIAPRQWIGAAILVVAGVDADAGIFTCKDAQGRTITGDRVRADCVQQTEHALTGEVRREVPKFRTPEEVAAEQEHRRVEAARKAEERKLERAKIELLRRFPDQASHDRARAKALASVRQNIRHYETRIASAEQERVKLMAEKEFYPGGNLPLKLRLAFEGNDATLAANRNALQTAELELGRNDATYDEELARLEALWGSKR